MPPFLQSECGADSPQGKNNLLSQVLLSMMMLMMFDDDGGDYEDDDQDDTEVCDGEMDEEEDHPVLVLLKQPLPQQVE